MRKVSLLTSFFFFYMVECTESKAVGAFFAVFSLMETFFLDQGGGGGDGGDGDDDGRIAEKRDGGGQLKKKVMVSWKNK